MAFVVLGAGLAATETERVLPHIASNAWIAPLIFIVLLYLLVAIPLSAMKKKDLPSAKLE